MEMVLQRARGKFPQARPRIISDNGPQFVAKEYIRRRTFAYLKLEQRERIIPWAGETDAGPAGEQHARAARRDEKERRAVGRSARKSLP